jgi:predicted lipid-binding transport protein (Tim44 family)
MWKLGLAFVAFAALALFILSRSGNIELDLTGEKHSVDAPHAAPAAASAAAASTPEAPTAAPTAAPAVPAAPAAPAASAAAASKP